MTSESVPLLNNEGIDELPDGFDHELDQYHSQMTKIAFAIENTKLGRYWDLLDAVINTALCIMYLILVSHVDLIYVKEHDNNPNWCPNGLIRYHKFCREYIPFELQAWDTSLCILLAVVVFSRAVFSLNLRYFYTVPGIITILTCLPPIGVFIKRSIHDDPEWTLSYLGARYIAFFYPIRWFRLKQSLSILLIPSSTSLFDIPLITRKVIKLTMTITLMLLVVSCYIHIFHIIDVQDQSEANDDLVQKDKSFWETFFFTLMSSTSGLSTTIIEVNTWYIQFLLVSILVFGIFYLPPQVSNLIDIVRSKSSYSFPYQIEPDTKHVIITGTFNSTTLIEFLYEFYHVDHGFMTSKTNAVILYPDEPDEDVKTLLNDPMFSSKLFYIKGSSVDFEDLKLAKIKHASACFILSVNNPQFSPNEIDSEGLMRCIAISKSNPNCTLLTQCLVLENKPHFEVVCNKILCIDEMKLGFLAQNCKTPGFTTLIHILTSSISHKVEQQLVQCEFDEDTESNRIFANYARGLSQEFYCVPIPLFLVNTLFIDACKVIYNKFHAVVFAVGKKIENNKMQTFICPVDYVLTKGDVLIVISSSSDFASKIPKIESNSTTTSRVPSPVSPLSNFVYSTDSKPLDQSNTSCNNLGVSGSMIENALPPTITNHVLLCSNSHSFPRSLAIFIKPYRAYSNNPVVILCPVMCDPSIYRQLAAFKDVYVIKGSPLIQRDLTRANCHSAINIIVLSANVSSNDYTLDATTITTVLNVQQMKQNTAKYCVDFFDMNNSAFTTEVEVELPEIDENMDEYLFSSSYMSGNAFSRSMIDVQLCQSFYNPFLLSMLKGLINMKSAKCSHVQLKNNMRWKVAFNQCLDRNEIAFGIYKLVQVKGKEFYCTIPNPDKDLILTPNDYIFVFEPVKVINK
eukprot:NODE_128_length_18581_cov_0.247538.p2 type:complete len:910 gc:universal NODE_128_length_18581_cov_0.247538:16404-13675(-)